MVARRQCAERQQRKVPDRGHRARAFVKHILLSALFPGSAAAAARFSQATQVASHLLNGEGAQAHCSPTGSAMSECQTLICVHNKSLTMPCCLCGHDHEQQGVAVCLQSGEGIVGDVCPSCLSREPRQAAELLRQRARELARHVAQTMRQVPAQARQPVHERLGRSELSRANGKDTQQLLPAPIQVGRLIMLALSVSDMSAWDTSLAQLIANERTNIRTRFPDLSEKYLRRLVDDRYGRQNPC
jgi:hypothetical protein